MSVPVPDKTLDKSSFVKRQISKEDAIKQVYRPHMANKVDRTLDVFERLVSDLETVTKLGEVLNVGRQVFHLTPDDLATNLDEFGELQQIAVEGRAFLTKLGYVAKRKNKPFVGQAPVGKAVDVMPIETQLPGSEPLQGIIVKPAAK